MWQVGRLQVGGTGALQNPVPNIVQGNNEDSDGQAKPCSIIIPAFTLDGKFTKACLHLGSNENLVKMADINCKLFAAWFSEDTQVSHIDRIQRVGEQLAPFPLLAVNANDNTVCVLHSFKRFAASFGTQHSNEGDVLAFKNNTNEQCKDLPQIVKIDTLDWYEATDWQHPNQETIETTNAQYSQVISFNASRTGVSTSKIIPIPLFLVSFFMNGGYPQSTLVTCQAFHTSILHNASYELQDRLQHVRNFLIVASGAETNPQDTTKLPVSQLAIKMDLVPLDQIIHPWAEHQISKIVPAAAAYEARTATPNNVQSPQLAQQENQRVERNAPGQDSHLVDMMSTAGIQQQSINNSGTTSSFEVNAVRQSRQESSRKDNTAQYPEYASERERIPIVQNTNVGQQHPVSYTNFNPAHGGREGHNTLFEGRNQQGQFGANSHNDQPAMGIMHNNEPRAYSQGTPHRYGEYSQNGSQSATWGQGNPMGQQTLHNYNPHQGNHESQFQNGTTYPGTRNFGPNSYDMQIGYMGGMQQQPPPNYWPAPQMDQFRTPSLQHQAHQYDSQLPYPHMHPHNYHPNPQVNGPQYNTDPQWMNPYGQFLPYPVPTASGKTAKMLHGVNRYHVLGFCGRSAFEDVTEIFHILDSNEDWMTKCNELENRLSMEQRENPLIGFTL